MIRYIYKFIKQKAKLFYLKKNNVKVAKGSYIHPDVNIGTGTRINHISHLGDCDIGKYCAIGGRLIIRSTNHHTCYLNMQSELQKKICPETSVAGLSKGRVSIGNAVWIGDSVVILPGVKIGDGAIIGAGSIVTKSIPAYSIAAGNPAKVIKNRFSEHKTEIIKRINWWDWSYKQMKDRKEFFSLDLYSCTDSELMSLIIKHNLWESN